MTLKAPTSRPSLLILPAVLAGALMLIAAFPLAAQRETLALDGVWEIEESREAEAAPESYSGTVAVPGLVQLALPPFPASDNKASAYFWYRRTFLPPARKEVALLRIGKAQFGLAVWVNGQKVGESLSCFAAAYFDLTGLINWDGENTLIVRVGAHPSMLPKSVPSGTDNEKLKWTPGIYDRVSLIAANNPIIESVQVAPRTESSEIVVQTTIRNYGPARTFRLTHSVRPWPDGRQLARIVGGHIAMKADSEHVDTRTVKVTGARLWSPENPHLHVLTTTTGSDVASTRFGMRDFRIDPASGRALLNGKIYFLRGSNITLHRFFEDPDSGSLPWREEWVRKLLIDIPKRMHWNSFRFCIGPVPDFWLDVADEAGLLVQNEFFVWGWRKEWNQAQVTQQYKDWLRDNWNHPSVVIWDASNETRAPELAEVIREVRQLDLSGRPWENGYNLPADHGDVIEDHPYFFNRVRRGEHFDLSSLEKMSGTKSTYSPHPSAHAKIINEYGYLWVNRDGSPTELTRTIYEKLLGADATAEQRLSLNAYLLAGLTEYWRAHRNFAGVLHFVYLTGSFPGAYTSDHFRDIRTLELHPQFADYVGEAFKPLGVYLNFWQPALEGGKGHRFAVMMVNDEPQAAAGMLALQLEDGSGKPIARGESRFALPALGNHVFEFNLDVPRGVGKCMLRAVATPAGGSPQPTVSRRWLTVN